MTMSARMFDQLLSTRNMHARLESFLDLSGW